jgi:hypothetical protein
MAIASIRRAAYASCVWAAALRSSAADMSNRVIATVIATPFAEKGRRITPRRVAPIHIRVNGTDGWYYLASGLGESEMPHTDSKRPVIVESGFLRRGAV